MEYCLSLQFTLTINRLVSKCRVRLKREYKTLLNIGSMQQSYQRTRKTKLGRSVRVNGEAISKSPISHFYRKIREWIVKKSSSNWNNRSGCSH